MFSFRECNPSPDLSPSCLSHCFHPSYPSIRSFQRCEEGMWKSRTYQRCKKKMRFLGKKTGVGLKSLALSWCINYQYYQLINRKIISPIMHKDTIKQCFVVTWILFFTLLRSSAKELFVLITLRVKGVVWHWPLAEWENHDFHTLMVRKSG